MNTELVERIVEDCCPERQPTAVEPMTAGGRRPTAVVRFADSPPLVVQLASDAAAVRTEATLLAAVREHTSVPVATVVASGVHADTPYLVSDHRPGRNLHTVFTDCDPARQRAIAGSFGRYLGELHDAFAFDGCGELTADDGRFTAPESDCGRWLTGYGRTAIERLPSSFDHLRDRLLAVLEDTPSGPPRLFPWDLRPGNALATDGTISAVVDWERPMAAPAALAVAKTEYLVADWYVPDPGPLRTAFHEGYESVRRLPTVAPGHRVVAIADSAVDSDGVVTNPRYPELGHAESVAFHNSALAAVVSD